MMRAIRILSCCSLVTVFALSLLLMPSTASAEPRAHDGGFFLRLSGGGAYATSSIDVDLFGNGVSEFKITGSGADLNIAVGGVVANNLALHGTIWGWLVSKPDAEYEGSKGEVSDDVDFTAAGGGVTYYFMPVNMYLSGSVGLGKLSVGDGSTDAGLALDVTLGKEWWVGSKWGIGLAGAFGYHSVPDGDVDGSWSGTSFSLRFSATMN